MLILEENFKWHLGNKMFVQMQKPLYFFSYFFLPTWQPFTHTLSYTMEKVLKELKHQQTCRLEFINLHQGCPAKFSSNLPQHTCLEVYSMPSKSLISWFKCVWLGLELNSADTGPPGPSMDTPDLHWNILLKWKCKTASMSLQNGLLQLNLPSNPHSD